MRKTLLVTIVVGSMGTACASSPTFVPFAAEKAGNSASQTIRVHRESGWTARLAFITPKDLTGRDDPRLLRLHSVVEDVSGGSTSKQHKGIRLLLTIQEVQGQTETPVLKKKITEEPLYGSGSGATYLHIDGFRLRAGTYRVTVQTLDDDPRLGGFDIALSVGTKPLSY